VQLSGGKRGRQRDLWADVAETKPELVVARLVKEVLTVTLVHHDHLDHRLHVAHLAWHTRANGIKAARSGAGEGERTLRH